MRTTIRISDELLLEIKKFAASTNRTLTSVIEDALREVLARKNEASQRKQIQLTTVPGLGLQPGVDLDDSAELLSLMENQNDSS